LILSSTFEGEGINGLEMVGEGSSGLEVVGEGSSGLEGCSGLEVVERVG